MCFKRFTAAAIILVIYELVALRYKALSSTERFRDFRFVIYFKRVRDIRNKQINALVTCCARNIPVRAFNFDKTRTQASSLSAAHITH